jgi:DNA-directed RNA polymerase beta' subunit
VPSQDVVLGLYYTTRDRINGKGEGLMFADIAEVQRAFDAGEAELTARINVRLTEYTKDKKQVNLWHLPKFMKPLRAVRCSAKYCPRACRLKHQQSAEEKRNFKADQCLIPQMRTKRYGCLRR